MENKSIVELYRRKAVFNADMAVASAMVTVMSVIIFCLIYARFVLLLVVRFFIFSRSTNEERN